MKATVYYLTLSEDERAQVNLEGWGCDIGRAYLEARSGDQADALRLGLFRPAARLTATDADAIWLKLQNDRLPWRDSPAIECLTDFPRSMDVGDVVVWEDGAAERCANFGFKPVDAFEPAFPMQMSSA